MNYTEFPVYPNVKKTITLCKARLQILEIKMFESIRVAVFLMDERDVVMETIPFLIQGDEYRAWADDDKYIVNLIRQKIQAKYNP